MFQDRHNRKSGRSAEQNLIKTDNPNYEDLKYNLGFKESQGMAVRPKHSGLTWTKIRKVFLMTKAGGDPIEEIKKTPDAEDQYKLLMYQKV